jgi:proteasome lid subunit RPN8/RPN11
MNPIRLRQIHWDQIQKHLEECLPFEGCGLLAGLGRLVIDVHPVPNIMRSETGYRMDPEEQVRALLWIEAQRLDLLAIYHSHPAGPPVPSKIDRQQAAYPEAAHMICFRDAEAWSARAFSISADGAVQEVPIDWKQ